MCKRLKWIKEDLNKRNDLQIAVSVSQDPYSMVQLRWCGYVGNGFAKRNPIDERNAELGLDIAFGRALHQIAMRVYFDDVKDETLERIRRSMLEA